MNDTKTPNDYLSFALLFRMFNRRNILRTVLITLLFILFGLVIGYMKTPVYEAHTQLKLDINQEQGARNNPDDIIQDLHTSNISSLETELDVLHSDLLLSKVLRKVTDNVRYFQIGHLTRTDYYTNTPILLHDIKVYSRKVFIQTFIVTPVDQEHFKIKVKDKPWKKSRYNKVLADRLYQYGEKIETEDFSFWIENINVKIGEEYGFNILYEPLLIEQMKRHLNVRPASADSSVVDIYYEDTNPLRAKEFVEYLSHDYIALNIENKSRTTSAILKFIDTQIDHVKKKLELSATKLKKFKQQHEIINVDAKSQEIMDKLVETSRELEEAKVAYHSFSILKKELDAGNYSSVGGFSNEYQLLGTLVTNLQQAITDRDALLANFTMKHPDVIVATHRIQTIQRSIKRVAHSIALNLKKRLDALEKIYQKETQKLQELPGSEQQLVDLERISQVNGDLYSYLLQRKSELTLLKASKVADIEILGKPSIPLKPSKPNRKLILIVSAFLGFLASFIASLIRFRKRIKSIDDVRAKTSLPLYGVIPYVEDEKMYNRAYVLEVPDAPASEAFRAIRANLDYVVPETSKSRVVLVTSSVPHEGKTIVSANLAAVIGMSDKKTIILSLDLRRPQLHHKFSLPNDLGMSDLLAGKATLNEVVWQHSKYANLHIVTSGKIPPNPAELLSSQKMAELLLEELKNEYDYIILDTPPVNYVSDATVLFKYADLKLFVLKSDFTDERYLDGINHLVESLHLKQCGLILNAVKKADNKLEQFDKKYIYHDIVDRRKNS